MSTVASSVCLQDDASLGDFDMPIRRTSNDFVFDMNPRWQSAFLDSLDSSAQFETEELPPRPSRARTFSRDCDNKSVASGDSSIVGATTEFFRKAISKSSSFQHPERTPPQRRGSGLPRRGGATGLRASSFKDGELRRQRLNRGESKLRRMRVPSTIVAVETKLES